MSKATVLIQYQHVYFTQYRMDNTQSIVYNSKALHFPKTVNIKIRVWKKLYCVDVFMLMIITGNEIKMDFGLNYVNLIENHHFALSKYLKSNIISDNFNQYH